jgi:opacity protein-like surface antigen
MIRRATLCVLLMIGLVSPALAQEPKVTVGAVFGWTFSDGASGDAVKAPDGNTYNRLDPKDSLSFGFNVGYLVNSAAEVGFLFGRQQSALVADGTATKEISDLGISNYHGYFAYNFGESDATIRPYAFIGVGATSYSEVSAVVAGATRTLPGQTRFSTTWGGGVKVYPTPNAGFQAGIRWTPTYIKSDADGWWCDPWYGCYIVGDAQYANQWEFAGGVSFRF